MLDNVCELNSTSGRLPLRAAFYFSLDVDVKIGLKRDPTQ